MDVNKLKVCYIGGGSRNWAWVLLQDLCFEKEIRGTVELYDLDLEAARNNEAIGNSLMAEHNPGAWRFHANGSLQDALSGSDFVFISILPGDFEEMSSDVHAPEKYGIYQSVGDTVGPGGLVRAMRTLPQFAAIAQAVQKHAPHAWIINYTNPMTMCTRTLYQVYPAIKAFGCCHEVFNTQKLLAAVVEDAGLAPAGSIKREDITTRVLGINHFTWMDRAGWKDHDILPLYSAFINKYAAQGFAGAEAATTFAKGGTQKADPDEEERSKLFTSTEKVKMDLFRRFGLIAAAGDRHLAEFCPHSWYMRGAQHAAEWGYALTPVSWRIKNREKLRAQAKAYRDHADGKGGTKMEPVCSGEEGIKILKALCGLGNIVTNVNLPNRGQMPDLPLEAVVETNASFTRDGIEPVVSNGLPADVRDLVAHQMYLQEGMVEAVLAHDKERAYRVFCQDWSIANLSLKDARTLFDEMTAKTLHVCKEWWA